MKKYILIIASIFVFVGGYGQTYYFDNNRSLDLNNFSRRTYKIGRQPTFGGQKYELCEYSGCIKTENSICKGVYYAYRLKASRVYFPVNSLNRGTQDVNFDATQKIKYGEFIIM